MTHFPECEYLSIPNFCRHKSGSGIRKKLFINSLISVTIVALRKVHHVCNTIALGQLAQAKPLGYEGGGVGLG